MSLNAIRCLFSRYLNTQLVLKKTGQHWWVACIEKHRKKMYFFFFFVRFSSFNALAMSLPEDV